MRTICVLFVGLVFPLVGCGFSAEQQNQVPVLVGEHGDDLESVGIVARLRLVDIDGLLPTSVWLVEGEVSQASATRLRKGDVPKTVEDKRRPLFTWRSDGDLVLQPAEPLLPNADYTVVAIGAGPVARFHTADDVPTVLQRWGEGRVVPGGWLLYCAGAPPMQRQLDQTDVNLPTDLRAVLGPAEKEVQARAGVFDHGGSRLACLRLPVPADAVEAVVPPPVIGAVSLDPAPVAVESISAQEAASPSRGNDVTRENCPPADEAGGTACLHVSGATASLSLPAGVGAFVLGPRDGETAQVVLEQRKEASPITVGPLEARADYSFHWFHLSPSGEASEGTGAFSTGASAAVFVINEVLLDPRGQEPGAEWIEILNTGNAAGSLEGYRIGDSGGDIPLPDVFLEPGEFGIVVSSDYLPQPDLDVVPSARAVPIRMQEWLAGGLRNAGERVVLIDGTGKQVSTIPALPSAEGFSIARHYPLSADEPFAFCQHAEPGASPGSDNECAAGGSASP